VRDARDVNALTKILLRSVCVITVAVYLGGCATRSGHSSGDGIAGPKIYDPRAGGEEQLSAALTVAKRENKRVLLSLGANWCSDSQKMHMLLGKDPRIARELSAHYVLAMVDVNKRSGFPRNSALVTRFGEPLERGIPVLLVLSPEGEILNTDPSERLDDSDHKRPRRVLRYLQKWSGHASHDHEAN